MLPFILEKEEKICICLYLYKKLLEDKEKTNKIASFGGQHWE